jgi:drug/metabolite transporter (DMT)-like permease
MRRAYFKYILALLLFGSNGIIASRISLSSYEIVLLRTLIGSLLLIAIFTLTRGKYTFWRQHKRQFIYLIISGIAMGTSWMFLYEAYRQIGVSIASLAYYCGPVIVMALSPLLFHEKLAWPKVFGFLTVLCGVFLVNSQAFQEGKTVWGLFCGGMSAVMYAFMVIFNKKAKDITGLENSMLQLSISFLAVAVFVGIKQGLLISVASENWTPILILGLLNTGIGCYFYFSSIGHLPVQTVAICGYLEPLSAVIFSLLFLRETMQFIQILGAVFILGGAVFGECVTSPISKFLSHFRSLN